MAEEKDQYGNIEKIPVKGVRKKIFKHMIEATHQSAAVTHMDEADVTELDALIKKEKEKYKKKGIKVTMMPYLVKAIVATLKKNPYFNAHVDDTSENILLKKYYNIGVAVNTEAGLIVPVVKDADKKSIEEIAHEIFDLAARCNDRKVKLDELKGGTFTISNVGAIGGIFVTPILNYPEISILATGRTKERPVVVKGEIVIRKMLPLSLTFDHRVIDGAEAAKFCNELKEYLESTEVLLAEINETKAGSIEPF